LALSTKFGVTAASKQQPLLFICRIKVCGLWLTQARTKYGSPTSQQALPTGR